MKRLALLSALVLFLSASAALATARAAPGSAASPTQNAAAQKGVSATIRVDPLRALLKISSSKVPAGTADPVTLVVTNHGKTRLLNVYAALASPQQVRLGSSPIVSLGTLVPGASRTASWTSCATVPGTYSLLGAAAGSDPAGQPYVAYSSPQALVVTKGSGSC